MQRKVSTLAVGALAVSLVIPVYAQDVSQNPATARPTAAREEPREHEKNEERVEQLERKLEIIAEDLETMRREAIISEPEYKISHQLGPAASRVYSTTKPGVSIAGYGQGFYQWSDAQTNKANLLRQTFYFGYRFNDWIVFNSEIEFETKAEVEGETSGQSVDPIPTPDEEGEEGEIEREFEAGAEFAYLDFLLDQRVNVRAGLLLLPLGFINQIHEPPTFYGNLRPVVETAIIPTTTRENGVGIYGDLFSGTPASMTYALYGINSYDASGLEADGLSHVRQNGAAIAEDLAVTGSLQWQPTLGLILGGDFFAGDTAQNGDFDGKNVFMTLYDLRAQYKYRGLRVRALFAQSNINNSTQVNQTLQSDLEDPTVDTLNAIGSKMTGWYVEAAYNVLPWIVNRPSQSLSPWFRYSNLDTQQNVPNSIRNSSSFVTSPTFDRQVIATGIDYKPIPRVAIKLDYRNFNFKGTSDDENQVLVGLGYYF
ncbi:MAG: hypothetical protein L0H63_00770 [Nitrococcus sp.]|nr:hypothetical protein [Nitrococcus sp.]